MSLSSRRALCALILAIAPWAQGAELSLAEAERLALERDPMVRALDARARAHEERAVAGAQWPDPTLRVGALSLPVDTFDFDQEPMTQLQLGVQQRFGRGDTLELEGEALRERAAAERARTGDRRLRTRRAVRESYAAVLQQWRVADLLRRGLDEFALLGDVVEARFAAGRALQADAVRVEVERLRMEDRLIAAREAGERARAELARWIGGDATRPRPADWPTLGVAADLPVTPDAFRAHPLAAAFEAEVRSADRREAVAREATRPQWALDLAYGLRSGEDVMGRERPDFFSAMVMLDLPLFADDRQDRERAAAAYDYQAAMEVRNDALRELYAGALDASAEWAHARQRLAVLEESTLPEASAWQDAAAEAYGSGVGAFDDLVRATLAEVDLAIDRERMAAKAFRALARLHYYQGDDS